MHNNWSMSATSANSLRTKFLDELGGTSQSQFLFIKTPDMKKKISLFYIVILLISFLFHTAACGQTTNEFTWPNGAKAALCLTYDDGLPSQVHIAAPMLKKYNFKATFFPTLSSPSLYKDMDKWKSLVKDGHELGNHTLYHPCQKSEKGMDWVKDYHDLDTYSLERILEEIQLASSFLLALDGKTSRTFAYPCAHIFAGGISYKDTLDQYFIAARGSSEDQLELLIPEEIDLFNVQSWAPNNHSGDELISYIKKIIEHKTLSTFTFHGVGEDHMIVSKETHEEMLQYLDAHRDEIWVTTFQEATKYLRSQLRKEKTGNK